MTINLKPAALGCAVALMALAACAPEASKTEPAAPEAAAVQAQPEAVNGWRVFLLRAAATKIHTAKWKSETIDIPVSGNGGDLEYKLGMKRGDVVVYSIDYGPLEHPGMMVSEFHGHTEKGADGNGDLMFYSKTGGAAQSGSFQAPWDGIHGWYLKNDSTKDVVVKLEVAGFYERTDR